MTTLPNIKSLMLFQPHYSPVKNEHALCSMREYVAHNSLTHVYKNAADPTTNQISRAVHIYMDAYACCILMNVTRCCGGGHYFGLLCNRARKTNTSVHAIYQK